MIMYDAFIEPITIKRNLFKKWETAYRINDTIIKIDNTTISAYSVFDKNGKFLDSGITIYTLVDNDISIEGMFQ